MRAVLLTGHGGFDKLEVRDDVAVPVPGPHEVLIKVAAAGVNNTDINMRAGWYSKAVREATATAEGAAPAAQDSGWTGAAARFPLIQGADVCGVVVAAGAQVPPERLGERVLVDPVLRAAGDVRAAARYLGSDCDGGFAEYVCVPSRNAYAVNSALGAAQLASFPCAYAAAENMLSRAGVAAGETVLVTGASGGVGSAAVQLARRRGARIVAITAAEKAAAVTALGADVTVSRAAKLEFELGRDCVDVVVDVVGGEQFPVLLDVLRPGGRYAVAGAIAGPLVNLDLRTLYLKDLTLFGCTIPAAGLFADLVGYIERGEIAPLVARTYALRDIAAAQREFLGKRHTGKIVLIP